MKCVSCGEDYEVVKLENPDWTKEQNEDFNLAMKRRCKQCSLEVVFEDIGPSSSLNKTSGGGKRVIRDPKGL